MYKEFLDYLVDPITKEPFKLKVEEVLGSNVIKGHLISSSSTYPIVRGIPRFAGYYNEKGNYVKSFSYQWKKWAKVQFEDENKGRPMAGHTQAMWEKIVGNIYSDLGKQVIVDFGCGSGRFVDIVRRKNGRVIGLDLSEAVESAGEIFKNDPNVLICQADVMFPPIRADSVDGVFSIGVLHHTPNPKLAFKNMVNIVKPNSWLGLSVYGQSSFYDFPTVKFWRKLFKTLWPVFKYYPPLVYSYMTSYGLRPISYIPIFGVLVRGIFPFVRLPDLRWSVLDTFDSVTPNYQSTHESYEVFHWFKDNHLVEIEPSDWGFTSYHAKKR